MLAVSDELLGTYIGSIMITPENARNGELSVPLDTNVLNSVIAQPGNWLGIGVRLDDNSGYTVLPLSHATTFLDLVF